MFNEIENDLLEDLKDLEFAKAYGVESLRSELGLALFHARQKLKLTQKEVAEKLEVSQPYIAQIENGEVNTTSDTFGKMLAILGFKVSFNLEPLLPKEKELVSVNNNVYVVQDWTDTKCTLVQSSATQTGFYLSSDEVKSSFTLAIRHLVAVDLNNVVSVPEPTLIPNQPLAKEPELVLAA